MRALALIVAFLFAAAGVALAAPPAPAPVRSKLGQGPAKFTLIYLPGWGGRQLVLAGQ